MVMTRAERRRAEKQARKEPVYTLTLSQIEQFRKKAASEALNDALTLMFGIPVLMFNDHFKDLIRVNVDGKSRNERFYEYVCEYYKQFDEGYYTLEDVKIALKDELGIEIELK